jgi:hypothetical protein
METTDKGSSTSDDAERLEHVEGAMRKLAAQHDPDIPLLAKLDRLRTAMRQGLKRGRRGTIGGRSHEQKRVA